MLIYLNTCPGVYYTHESIEIRLYTTMPRQASPTMARYTTYCLISLTSVAIHHIRPSQLSSIWFLPWSCIPHIAIVVFYAVNDFINGSQKYHRNMSSWYTQPMAVFLVNLGHFAIWTQRYLAVSATENHINHDFGTQTRFIHFSMSFWVLSECEFWRLQLQWAKVIESYLSPDSLTEIIMRAQECSYFKESRDCCSY